MIWLGNILVVVVATLLLAAMMLTAPSYNRAHRPFVTNVAPDQGGQTRLFGGRITGWRTADRIGIENDGAITMRDTEGVFLIVDLTVWGTTASSVAQASWDGASKRRYDATKRISGLPQQLDTQWLQPGLEGGAFAIFELPPDEIAGGALLLSQGFPRPLDGVLRLQAPATPPPHEAVLRLEK